MNHRDYKLSPAVQVREILFVNQHHRLRECPLFAVCMPTISGKPKTNIGVPTYHYDRFHNGFLYRTSGGGLYYNSSGEIPDFIYID